MAKERKHTPSPKPTAQKTTQKAGWSAESLKTEKPKWLGWLNNLLPILLLVAGLVYTAVQLITKESEFLFKAQELSLWMPGKTFYHLFSIYPGGWLSWLGSFMTDFFYHPALGVTLLMVAWALIMGLIIVIYRLRGKSMLLAALPIMMLLACLTQTGYWIFYQKLHGHLWVPTLAVFFSLLFSCFTITPKTKRDEAAAEKQKSLNLHFVVVILIMILYAWSGYEAMGAWMFGGLLLMALPTCREDIADKRGRLQFLLRFALALLLIAIVPRIAYSWEYEQTVDSTLYVAGLPCFQYGQANVSIYRWTYYLLVASFLPILIAGLLRNTTQTTSIDGKTKASPLGGRKGDLISWICIIALLVFGAFVINDRWNHDKNLHAEVTMENQIDRQDWEGVLSTIKGCAGDTIVPTRAMVMMKNLALFRLGKTGDEMFLYPEGARQQNIDEWYKYGDKMYTYYPELDTITDPVAHENEKRNEQWMIRLSQVAGKMIYYNYGKMNFSYRWCMEDGVEFGWRAEELKLMAKCALLKGEWQVARKYFDLLKKTRYHADWARHYEPFIGHPEKMKTDPEFEQICYLKEFGDRLDGDNTLVEMYLLQTFAHGTGADPVYQEQTLIAALQMKDIDLFWPRFARYCNLHGTDKDFHVPHYYQEAAWLYCQLEPQKESVMWPGHSNAEAAARMPFDQSVKDKYNEFMQYNAQYNAQIGQQVQQEFAQRQAAATTQEEKDKLEKEMSVAFNEKMNAAFKPMFSDTFYFFYYLVRNQKTN